MSFDDGQQFVARKARTQTYFIVAATSKRGEMVFPGGQTENREEAERLVAEAEAKNNAWVGHTNFHIRVWLPEHRVMNDSISLEEWQATQPVVVDAVEITVQKSDTVKVLANSEVVYSGTSVQEAKATWKEYRENPRHGTSWVTMYHKLDGCWIASEKYHYNRHDEWLKDLRAGKFDAAYMRDYLNDLAVSPEARRRDAMVEFMMRPPMPRKPSQITEYR